MTQFAPSPPVSDGADGTASAAPETESKTGRRGRGVPAPDSRGRHRVPTVIQMESAECGAACLAMILGYYGKFVPLEELRTACGVSRDGARASSVVAAARKYGLIARGFQMEAEELATAPKPLMIFWAFQHFMVVEGVRRSFGKSFVAVNDPANGPREIEWDEFDSGSPA